MLNRKASEPQFVLTVHRRAASRYEAEQMETAMDRLLAEMVRQELARRRNENECKSEKSKRPLER